MACFGIDDLFSFAFSSYSIMDVSLPQCTTAVCKNIEPLSSSFSRKLTTMAKPALRILWSHRKYRLTNGFLQRFTCASPAPTQMRLQFGKRFFNGGEVRRIAWQKEQLASLGLNQVLDLLAFMGRQVIHDHNLSSSQAWCQDLFDIQFKSNGIG